MSPHREDSAVRRQLEQYECDLAPVESCIERFERGDEMPGLSLDELDEDIDAIVTANVDAIGERRFPVSAAMSAAALRARITRLRDGARSYS